jgi:hypothetical protein
MPVPRHTFAPPRDGPGPIERKTPTQQQIDWVRKNPAGRERLLDVEFGNGAWEMYGSKECEGVNTPLPLP